MNENNHYHVGQRVFVRYQESNGRDRWHSLEGRVADVKGSIVQVENGNGTQVNVHEKSPQMWRLEDALDVGALELLALLYRDGRCTAMDLVRKQLSRQAMYLTHKGLVQETVDKRNHTDNQYSLTDEGRRYLEEVHRFAARNLQSNSYFGKQKPLERAGERYKTR